MQVTRIEIFGFKSFMDRLVLPLENGITGVVGPNGCGKSNIVDAVRWVLGETRASTLRGGTLEDVIFNGTDKLRPLGLAEVTLTLRASEDNFFADLVSPALEADFLASALAEEVVAEEGGAEDLEVSESAAGSESAATPEVATLPQEESEGGGRGAPHLTVISGALDDRAVPGQRDEPEEPLQPLQPKIENQASVPTLMARFSWLKSVNEVQVTRRLYRSGESEYFINRVPCRLKDLKDLYRAVGLGARAYTIVAQGEVSRIVTAKAEERRLILEEAAGVLGFRDKIAAAGRRLEETGVNISRLDDLTREVSRQVATLKRQAARAEARAELKARAIELDQGLLSDRLLTLATRTGRQEGVLGEFRRLESERTAALQAAHSREEAARGELMTIDVQSDELRGKMDALREELNNRARERSGRQSRINELRAFVLARGTEIRRLEERRNVLRHREGESAAEVEELKRREEALVAQIHTAESGGEDALKAAAAELHSVREQLRLKEHALREMRERLVSERSSLAAITDQLIAASPVTQLKKTLGEHRTRMLSGFKAELFVEGLSVPAEYSRAVQSVLAERGEFLVSDRPEEIARAFVTEIVQGAGREARGLGLGVFRSGRGTASAPTHGGVPFPRLLDLVGVSEACRGAAERLFAGVYCAATLDEALSFFAERGELPGVTLVTAEGDLVTDFSFYSLRHDGGLVQLKNRAEELKRSLAEREAVVSTLTAEREALQAAVATAEARHAEALRESRARQAQARDLSNQLGNVRGRQQAAQRLLEQLGQDLVKADQQMREAEARIAEYQREERQVQESLQDLSEDQDRPLQEQLAAVRESFARVDEVRRAGHATLSALNNELTAARRGLDEVRTSLNEAMLEIQKLSLEQESLVERTRGDYGEEFLAVVLEAVRTGKATVLVDEDRTRMAEELGALRARMLREGEVDPTSIERYREEDKRLQELTSQKEDLEQAAATLRKTIERLTQTSQERFLATFEAIRSNFSRLVPRLFGGGKADLELLDPANPLDSGVEIIARPPGKKLKSIELLSGGEKALCATALIMAMFLERPSPLCLLDEVDAPLDEANLVRFLSLIREMSARTQFIMITHNKGSMGVCNNLVGVTMQEPGASRVISVSLQDAVSQVA